MTKCAVWLVQPSEAWILLTKEYIWPDVLPCQNQPKISLQPTTLPSPPLCAAQGWGLLSQFSPFHYFPLLSKQTLAIQYHVYIWQVLPQLSCGDTCQIWMWFRESNRYFCNIENFAYGEISERSFSNPHPWHGSYRNLHMKFNDFSMTFKDPFKQ